MKLPTNRSVSGPTPANRRCSTASSSFTDPTFTLAIRTGAPNVARYLLVGGERAGWTAMHPLVPGLADPPTQGELLKALYELTKSVEAAKKHLLKLEKRDDSAVL